VTDGETNASLRKGDEVSELTVERALELMQQRREYMASPEGQARAGAKAAKRAGKGGKKPKNAKPKADAPRNAGVGGKKKAQAARVIESKSESKSESKPESKSASKSKKPVKNPAANDQVDKKPNKRAAKKSATRSRPAK
jgi:DNA topoisomerase-1